MTDEIRNKEAMEGERKEDEEKKGKEKRGRRAPEKLAEALLLHIPAILPVAEDSLNTRIAAVISVSTCWNAQGF